MIETRRLKNVVIFIQKKYIILIFREMELFSLKIKKFQEGTFQA